VKTVEICRRRTMGAKGDMSREQRRISRKRQKRSRWEGSRNN